MEQLYLLEPRIFRVWPPINVTSYSVWWSIYEHTCITHISRWPWPNHFFMNTYYTQFYTTIIFSKIFRYMQSEHRSVLTVDLTEKTDRAMFWKMLQFIDACVSINAIGEISFKVGRHESFHSWELGTIQLEAHGHQAHARKTDCFRQWYLTYCFVLNSHRFCNKI